MLTRRQSIERNVYLIKIAYSDSDIFLLILSFICVALSILILTFC
jgi:hypothetical protein